MCLKFFHLLALKPNLERFSIYSNKFFNNFHLTEYSFTCPMLRAGGFIARRLGLIVRHFFININHIYMHLKVFIPVNRQCLLINTHPPHPPPKNMHNKQDPPLKKIILTPDMNRSQGYR